MKRIGRFTPVVINLLVVASCMTIPEIHEMDDPLPTGMEGTVARDCAVVESIVERFETWIDTNGNGIREAGEDPLEGVKISFSYSPIEGSSCSGTTFRASGVTGPDGQVELSYPDWTERSSLQIEAPPGYKQTGEGPGGSIGFAPIE